MNGEISKEGIVKVLEWRSISVYVYPKGNDSKRRILIGTDTGMKESNYTILLQYDEERGDINIMRKYKHTGNVLKVLGVNESKCITASSDNSLYLYDLKQTFNEVSTRPDLMFSEHKKACTGISLNKGTMSLLSSSEDGQVCLWDLCSIGNLGILKPIRIISAHEGKGINDVNWSRCNDNLFASGGEDHNIAFYDKRAIDKYTKVKTSSSITKVAFNCLNPNLFLSANSNNLTDLWDLRNTKVKLHSFQYHKEPITSIKWSNTNESHFASSSLDKSLVFWNIHLLEKYKTPVSTEDNPFEAISIHRSKEKISDFDWKDNLISVVNVDNTINVMNHLVDNI